jgi:AraC-like DNA-binding protein
MPVTTTLHRGSLTVIDYRCTAQPSDAPFTEVFAAHSVSYVRRGSFGLRSQGCEFELVAGSVLLGYPGDEYLCTHEHHHCSDECLSFRLSAESAERLNASQRVWRQRCLPPLSQTMILGELAQAAAAGRTDVGIDEVGELLAARVVDLLSDRPRGSVPLRSADRRRAVEAAQWIEARFAEPLCLDSLAQRAALSPFHFLRVFRAVLGVTPHQFLVRTRLRRAARLLVEGDGSILTIALTVGFADLSNFVRTFRRAAGLAPSEFRRAARQDRKILQEAFARTH